jgi:hypothetical protein
MTLSAQPEATEQNNVGCIQTRFQFNIRALRSFLGLSVIEQKKEEKKEQVIEIYRVLWRCCSSVFVLYSE